MKLILNEKQYDRLFSSKKRKLVVTESQYNRLLNESDLSDGFTKIKKFDIIKIDKEGSKDSTLHFRVMYINSNELIMINCNDGVYKNAYFYINKNGYSGDSLKYRIAQNKDIEASDSEVGEKNLLDTLGDTKIWRNSTFNNITNIDIYVDGEQDCNLSDNAKKKLTIVDDGSKDDSEDDSKEGGGDDDGLKEVIELFKDVKPKNKYKITIGKYIANDKRNKGSNEESGSIFINVTEVSSNNIFFEALETEGEAKEYDDLLDKDLTFIKNSKNIAIQTDSKADFKMFNIKIEVRDGKTSDDDGGSLSQKDDVIADIMNFELIGPYDSEEKEKESEDIEAQLTDDEQDELVKKLVTNNKFLQNAIASKPNKVLELLGLARKKGTLPIKGRMDKWYNSVTDKVLEQKNFPINKVFTANLDKGSFNFKDKSISSGINFNSDVKVKSLKPNSNDNKIRFGTNFSQTVKQEETYKYNITLIKQIKEDEKFYIYEVKVYYNSNEKSSSEYVGEGKLRIIKDVKK